MASAAPIGNLAECYANALAIEREAAARSAQFAEYLEDHGELATAELFRRLARFERQHVDELERRTGPVSRISSLTRRDATRSCGLKSPFVQRRMALFSSFNLRRVVS